VDAQAPRKHANRHQNWRAVRPAQCSSPFHLTVSLAARKSPIHMRYTTLTR
jgi:hypothetical protein